MTFNCVICKDFHKAHQIEELRLKQRLSRRRDIAKLRAEGKTYAKIGSLLGLSRQRVHSILKGGDTV